MNPRTLPGMLLAAKTTQKKDIVSEDSIQGATTQALRVAPITTVPNGSVNPAKSVFQIYL